MLVQWKRDLLWDYSAVQVLLAADSWGEKNKKCDGPNTLMTGSVQTAVPGGLLTTDHQRGASNNSMYPGEGLVGSCPRKTIHFLLAAVFHTLHYTPSCSQSPASRGLARVSLGSEPSALNPFWLLLEKYPQQGRIHEKIGLSGLQFVWYTKKCLSFGDGLVWTHVPPAVSSSTGYLVFARGPQKEVWGTLLDISSLLVCPTEKPIQLSGLSNWKAGWKMTRVQWKQDLLSDYSAAQVLLAADSLRGKNKKCGPNILTADSVQTAVRSRQSTDHRSSTCCIQEFHVCWRRPCVRSWPRKAFNFLLATGFHTHH